MPEVKFTDIDYVVFTDAARSVAKGGSPYARATYRYTPLLSFMMLPNVAPVFPNFSKIALKMLWGIESPDTDWIAVPGFGKLLFVFCDLISGYLIYDILLLRLRAKEKMDTKGSEPIKSRSAHANALIFSSLWLLNPFVATISTRGSAESVMSALCLGTLGLLLRKRITAAAVVYGIAVHFKIYPIIHALPFFFFVGRKSVSEGAPVESDLPENNSESKLPEVNHNENSVLRRRTKFHDVAANTTDKGSRSAKPRDLSLYQFLANFSVKDALKFAVVSAGVFFTLCAAMWLLYGREYIEEAWLYHLTRKDHRHNYSAYFYQIYLTYNPNLLKELDLSGTQSALLQLVSGRLTTFVPQFALVGAIGLAFADDIAFMCFAQTFVFVMLNKVCTAQYFMWYLCYLPLVLPFSKLIGQKWKAGLLALFAWIGGQACWLYFAYQLEHQGHDTFHGLWVSGLLFYIANLYIVTQFIRCHQDCHKI
ncbi:PIG-M-domain-containing protein [Cladochytrium replicatum]|nr:PIG-M-domain-containing protein [Cladochytrium replicatum]